MSERPDRDELIRIARELQERADDDNDDITELLARFNGMLGSNVDGHAFRSLHEDRWTPTPEALVDDLLEAGGFVTRPAPSRVDLDKLLARLEAGPSTNADVAVAASALNEVTDVDWSIAHALCERCRTLGASVITDFAQAYVPPANREELLVLLRRWIEDLDAARDSVYVAIGELLVHRGHQKLGLAELAPIAQHLFAASDVQKKIALQKLRPLLGLPPPPRRQVAKPAAPPPAQPIDAEQRVRHATFGVGLVTRREGEGADEKLTVRFASGTKTLLARFVEPCE